MILLLALAYPAAIAILFYFAFLRPVQQESRHARNELMNLKIGDTVVTQGGFIALVKDIVIAEDGGSTELILELAKGVEVRALATAVARRLAVAAEPVRSSERVTDVQ